MADVGTIPNLESLAESWRDLRGRAVKIGRGVGYVGGLWASWHVAGSLLAALASLGLVLASGRLSGFARWARKRRADLLAAGLPVPSWRVLWAVRKTETKRLRSLVDHWPSRCTENGLKLTGRAPVLVGHAVDLDGNVAAKLIRTGFDPDDVKAKARKLAKGIGCREIVVRETSPGCADVSFIWTDPLRNVLPLAALPWSDPGQVSFGVTASGEPATIEADLATLFAGVTGSGKSNAALAALADLIRKGEHVRLWVSNPKITEAKAFAEFEGDAKGRFEVRRYAEGTEDPKVHTKLIADFEHAMKQRNKAIKGRKLTRPTKENPRVILWLDEVLSLPKDTYNGPFSPLGRILTSGRSSLYTIWACTQSSYAADLGTARALFSQRVAFRTMTEEITDTILGSKATARGARCHTLHKKRERGVGYVADAEEELVKFRAAKVTDADVACIIRGQIPAGMKTGPDPEPEPIETGRDKLRRWATAAWWWLRARGIGGRRLIAGGLALARRGAVDKLAAILHTVASLPFLASFLRRDLRIRATEPLAAVLAFLGRKSARAAVSAAVFAQLLVAMAR